jgi:hypothetical protein
LVIVHLAGTPLLPNNGLADRKILETEEWQELSIQGGKAADALT